MASTFGTQRDGRVLVVRFDNPPRNFMDRTLVSELTALVRSVGRDRTIGAIVLTGGPDDLFVTHYDVAELLAGAEQAALELSAPAAGASYRAVVGLARIPGAHNAMRRTPARGVLDLEALQGLFRRIERLDKIVVAAINGQALSIGCELALACDVRYIADDARAIGLPEMTLGLLPGGGGTQRLARTVGQARALELILEATLLTPQEALEIGLVHRVVPHAQLLDEALATAHRLARRASLSVAGAKRAVLEGASRPLPEGLARRTEVVHGGALTPGSAARDAPLRRRPPQQWPRAVGGRGRARALAGRNGGRPARERRRLAVAATFRTERDGRVLVVLLDNAPLHLIDRRMVDELTALVRQVERDSTIGSIVVTGAERGRFVTHYDVAEMLAGAEGVGLPITPAGATAASRTVAGVSMIPRARRALRRSPLGGVVDLQATTALFRRLELLDKVVIAAIGGPALGAACELVLACDLRYVADDVPAIGSPEMTQGYSLGAGGTQRLARALGQARALEAIVEARMPAAAEALELGLVHRVVPAERLLDEALATAHRLARRAPIAVAALKRAVYDGASRSLPAGLALERNWFMAALSRPAARRAMRRYVDDLARDGRGPWEDPRTFEAWRDGTAVDLHAR